jgi:hypothetical protein
VIFYNSELGKAVIGHVEPFGTYRDLKVAFSYPFPPGWTHVVATGKGRLLFYNKSNGAATVGHVATDGTYSEVKAYEANALPAGLTQIVATGHGLILTWTQGTLRARSLRVEADGTLTSLYSFRPEVAGWLPSSTTWTHLVGLENGVMVFYERGTSKAETVRLGTDGNVTKLRTFNKLLLQYYMTDGRGVVSRFDANGNEVAVVKHPDPSRNLESLPRAMPIVAGLTSGPLVFYNDSDGSMTTGRITAEGVVIYERGCCGAVWTHVVGIR